MGGQAQAEIRATCNGRALLKQLNRCCERNEHIRIGRLREIDFMPFKKRQWIKSQLFHQGLVALECPGANQ